MKNYLTLGQASKLTGKSKPTISKAVKDGKISAEKVDGVYQIEISELTRVYEAKGDNPAPAPMVSGVAEIENRFLKEKIDDLQDRLTEMKTERDTALQEAREDRVRLMGLLEDQRPKSFWSRLVGK